MQQKAYTLSEIRDIIIQLPEQFEQGEVDIVTVMQDGKPVMDIVPHKTFRELVETLDSLLETLEVVQDEELMASFRQGMKDIEEGRVIPWEQAKKELGWE